MIPILLLEDDLIFRTALRNRLTTRGYQVIAPDLPVKSEELVLAAREACRLHQPAAAVVDLGLGPRGPDSGLQVIRELLTLESPPRVLAITGELNSPSVSLIPSGVSVLEKDENLAPADDSDGHLYQALLGIGHALPDLPSRLSGYIEGLQVATELWLKPLNSQFKDLMVRLQYHYDHLVTSHDHKKHLAPLLSALGNPTAPEPALPEWPPSPPVLKAMRDSVQRVSALLDPRIQHETIRFLTHEVANNFLLGWQMLQAAVNDKPVAQRLLEAASEEEPLANLLRQCTELLGTHDKPASKQQVEKLRQILDERYSFALSRDGQPVYLEGWGRIRKLLVVENDPIIGPLLASLLCHSGRDIEKILCDNTHQALRELVKLKKSPDAAVLLDLSLPTGDPAIPETPNHGLLLLAKAKELRIPVVVVSGAEEFPHVVTRCQELRPWAYLLKSTPRELTERLLTFFHMTPPLRIHEEPTLHLLVWTGQHANLLGRTVHFTAGQHSLLELLGNGTIDIKGHLTHEKNISDLYHALFARGHLRPRDKTRGANAADQLKRVRNLVKEVNEVLQTAFQEHRGRLPSLPLQVNKDGGTYKIRSKIPIKLSESQLDVPLIDTTPRLLLVAFDNDFADAVTKWLSTLTPKPEILRAPNVEEGRRYFKDPNALPDIVVIEPSAAEQHWLDWVADLRYINPPPDLIMLTARDDNRLRIQVNERFREPVHYVVKQSDHINTLAQFSLAYTELTRHRSGLPFVDNTGHCQPFMIKLPTIVSKQHIDPLLVEINGLPIEIRGDAAQALFLVLADHFLQGVCHARLLTAIRGKCDESERDFKPVNDTAKFLRNQICEGFVRHGSRIGRKDLICGGYRFYWLNGIVLR